MKKGERNGRKTGRDRGDRWRSKRKQEGKRMKSGRVRGRDQDGCCGLKASAAAVASEMELK